MRRENIYATVHLAGMVKRYHTWPMIRPQSIAEHCWRVAGIYVEIFGMPRAEVLYFCLHHDSGELWSGDIPFKIKKAMPELGEGIRKAEKHGLEMLKIQLPELTEAERIKVKISDLLEMFETGFVEFFMGNKFAKPIISDTLAEANKLANANGFERKIGEWLHKHSILEMERDK